MFPLEQRLGLSALNITLEKPVYIKFNGQGINGYEQLLSNLKEKCDLFIDTLPPQDLRHRIDKFDTLAWLLKHPPILYSQHLDIYCTSGRDSNGRNLRLFAIIAYENQEKTMPSEILIEDILKK